MICHEGCSQEVHATRERNSMCMARTNDLSVVKRVEKEVAEKIRRDPEDVSRQLCLVLLGRC